MSSSDSDDQELLDKVNAKLKSLKSNYGSEPSDDEVEGKISSAELQKTAMSESSEPSKNTFSNWFKRTAAPSSSAPKGEAYIDDSGAVVSVRLLVTRAEQNQALLLELDSRDQDQRKAGSKALRDVFNEYRKNVENHGGPEDAVDWDHWAAVINNFPELVQSEPEKLHKELGKGVPAGLRGIVWQVIAELKLYGLEEAYTLLVAETSPHEKQIRKDLARTRFVADSAMAEKSNGLFNVVKAYLLFDTEVGYTQGMAFVAVPLLMNMDESEAFCLMAALMKAYGMRDLYLPDMPGLHVLLYQLERLIEDAVPRLHTHLARQGVRPLMYALQWFLTMFAYRFPLDIVIRVYDMILAEGVAASLKFAVALLVRNEEALLRLGFDDLVDFLKERLFDYYLEAEDGANPFGASGAYRVDELVADAMRVKVVPEALERYEKEHAEMYRLEKEREEEIEALRTKNAQLTREIRKLEQLYAMLNKEHVEVANEMIQGKVNLANLEDENSDLRQEVEQLAQKVRELESEQQEQLKLIEKSVGDAETAVQQLQDGKADQESLEAEIRKTMERNLEVMEANRFLEEQLSTLERQYKESKAELEEVRKEHEVLKKKWGAAKSLFEE